MRQMQWLKWARELQAIAQNGLTFAQDPYDIERYESIGRIAAEIVAGYSSMPVDELLALFAAEHGYATPKVDCRGFAVRDDKVLLVRERREGLWTLPGGWIDVGEAPSEAAEREVREESGYIVRTTKLAAVYDRDRHGHPPLVHSVYKLFFICDIIGGEPAQSAEVDAVGFFGEHDLPELSASRITGEEIARCFEHYRNPGLTTDFD